MKIQTDEDIVLNRLHPRLLALNLRFVRSNHVIYLWRGLGETGSLMWGPFPDLEYTEWAVGELEKYEKGKVTVTL
jgi:hypothetical protein